MRSGRNGSVDWAPSWSGILSCQHSMHLVKCSVAMVRQWWGVRGYHLNAKIWWDTTHPCNLRLFAHCGDGSCMTGFQYETAAMLSSDAVVSQVCRIYTVPSTERCCYTTLQGNCNVGLMGTFLSVQYMCIVPWSHHHHIVLRLQVSRHHTPVGQCGGFQRWNSICEWCEHSNTYRRMQACNLVGHNTSL